jgi:small subunit ribosomal protein S15
MELANLSKADITKKFGRNEEDTGSDAVQIALLTKRIQQLSDHFRAHKKDNASRRGLLMIVSQRKSLLRHLRKQDPKHFEEIANELSIRTGAL